MASDLRKRHSWFSQRDGRATIFITHRLANTRLADRIIVLNQGRIEQMGTYDELARQGLFHELLKLQEDR